MSLAAVLILSLIHEGKVHAGPGRPSDRYPAPAVEGGEKAEKRWKARRTRLVRILTRGKGEFSRPVDVTIGPRDGKIFVTDSGTNTVQVFDRQGGFLRTYGRRGDGFLRFRRLIGAAAGGDGYLYCLDAGGGAIVVVNPDGSVRNRIDLTTYFTGQKMDLTDVAVGLDGRLFVVDKYRNRVVILMGGELVRSFRGSGLPGGEFNAPTFGGLDAGGLFYLSDTLNGRVQVFDLDGNFVRAFAVSARGPGGPSRPEGVAVGARGEIYVADSMLNVIQVFDREGNFLAVLTDEKGELLDLGSPTGIALDRGDRIYLAERLSRRLQIREIIREE